MARTALDDLIDIYREAQLALVKIITGNTGAGTKTYYNSVLKQTEALLNRLSAQTGRYINTEIPKEYKAALESTYDYFKRNRLQMKRPDIFAQVHADAVSELAAEMQHHIDEGISNAGRRVIRYADSAMDNALRQNGLRASAVKIASGQTVRDMQKDLVQRLSEDGFLTVQYGSGEGAYQVGLDSYASMVARSTTREAGNLAREKQLTDNGYDLMIITEHHPCCGQCARVQGRVFSISGDDKRFPPLSAAFPSGYRNVHPNCSCVAVPWIEELQSPEELRQALEKGSQPLRDERSAGEKALYTQQQSDSRQMRADLVQFERYKARLGDDAPKSFSAFRRMKNAGGDRWNELQKEYRQRFEKQSAPVTVSEPEKAEGAYTEERIPEQQKFESYALKGSADIQFDRLDGSKSISSELAEEYRAEYDKFTEMFGELPSLNGIDIAPYANDDTYGQYYPESRRIVIYGAGGKSGDKFLLQSAQEHKRIEEWSTGSKYHSFRHELGHALQMEHSLNDKYWEKKKTEIETLRSSIVLALTNSDGSVKIKELKGKLSKYGFVDTDEFISECIAEYFQNPKKARSTSKKVIEIIMRGDEYYADVNS